ncbi:class I SAM-dependent methyltransferase [Algiphilus sp.]|uniref:class I SAM-dependent methyltransferase n=1 Tax=Algiphilus sp. TaxID=1872431 RepID=UPI002A5FCA97|nr:class I SAM-dependent methyltransferase [Pseudomonadota bacterium]
MEKKYRNARVSCAAAFLAGVSAYVLSGSAVALLLSAVAAVAYLGIRERETSLQFKQLNRSMVRLRQQLEAAMDVRRLLDHRAMPLPPSGGWAASSDFVALVGELLVAHRPRHIMELGSGLSTIFLADMGDAQDPAQITSLDHDPAYAEQTRAHLCARDLGAHVRVIDAPLQPLDLSGEQYRWYALPEDFQCPPIDFLIIDGPPSASCPMSRYPALPVLAPYLAAHCVVVIDDADRPDEKAMVARWAEQFGGKQRRLPLEKGAVVMFLDQATYAQTSRHP